MPPTIDLRSDTVTHPSPAMREAMATAEVGDDVYGEDPTINRLEALAAETMGKEAGLFVSSGTMSNLVAVMTHCQRGEEAILGSEAHILQYEVAGAAGVAGVQLRPVPNDEGGRLDPSLVEATIRGQNLHFPQTALVCLENTHNRCGGAVLTPEETRAVADVAHARGVRVHIDGARILNAAVALGVPASDLAREADSVGFCLSKGLAAPVGSVLCGSAEFIARARKNRKILGGGMRQAGIIAAAGVVALESMVERLTDDHANARWLADGLAGLPGVVLRPGSVQTNIIIFAIEGQDAPTLAARLRESGLLATTLDARRIRMVTHYGIERADVEEALDRVQAALGAVAA
ncbi:MAG: low-specificity L-threonine aldolase [Dehalococcoidia bacterium]|nr:low-specificity L-threonine aldolase [Dehalococcoidia bacterium]